MSKSIIQRKKECWLCRYLLGTEMSLPADMLEEHHVMFGIADRRLSESYGLKIWLCQAHHRVGMMAVHNNKVAADLTRVYAQKVFEKKYSHEDWMRIFGKNYL